MGQSGTHQDRISSGLPDITTWSVGAGFGGMEAGGGILAGARDGLHPIGIAKAEAGTITKGTGSASAVAILTRGWGKYLHLGNLGRISNYRTPRERRELWQS